MKVYRAFKGFPNKLISSKLWAAKKTKKGLNKPEFQADKQRGRFEMGQGQIETVGASHLYAIPHLL